MRGVPRSGVSRRSPRLPLALALLAAGCAKTREPPPAPPPAGERLFDDAAVRSRSGGAAGSAERPVPRCGPEDSYRYVADEFRCPGGGGNPFAGDVAAARSARVGSLGPTAQGHMIDVYEVPCPAGKVEVYVDMYGCPAMQPAADAGDVDPLRLDAAFAAGRYDEVRTRCADLPDDSAGMTVFNCSVLMPAVLIRGGEQERAIGVVGRTCQAFPPPGPRSGVRVELLVGIVDAVARMWASDGVPLEEGTRRLSTLLPRLLSACEVESEAFMRAFESATGPAAP